jgi:cytochrome c peroxidase
VHNPRHVVAALVVAALSAAFLAGDRDWNAEALARIAHPPLGLPSLVLSEQDAPDTERIALGRKLFFDPRLSGNGAMACATCQRGDRHPGTRIPP